MTTAPAQVAALAPAAIAARPLYVETAAPSQDGERGPAAPAHDRRWAWARAVLLVVGVAMMAWLVWSVGPQAVLHSLVQAAPLLPVIFGLEFAWVAFEGLGLLVLYGKRAREVPLRDWVNATLVQFTTMMVLPVGRAGAEVARATMLSRYVGGARAAASSSLMQALTLLANSAISALCAFYVVDGAKSPELAVLLIGNAAVTAGLGGGLYLVMLRARVGGFLGRRFAKLARSGPELDQHFRESRGRHGLAFVLVLGGRLVQTLQYGFLLYAVLGSFTATGTFLAQGIHLISAGLGDVVPNQVGVSEGAFRLFAGALGLAAHPEKAVSLALLSRVSTLTTAALCALAVQWVPRTAPPSVEPAAGLGDSAAGS